MTESSFLSSRRREPKKPVAIRLGKELLRDLKAIARIRGVRYQTLINEVLESFVGRP